jgi:2-methylcitrate dehydratase PrpD
MGPSHARLCFPYLGALVLTHGSVTLDHFDASHLAEPGLHTLAERITVQADDNPDPSAFVPARATIVTRDGRTLHHEVQRQYGSPEWPLSPDAQRAKADACCAFGGLPDMGGPLRAAIEELPDSDDAIGTLAPVFGMSAR